MRDLKRASLNVLRLFYGALDESPDADKKVAQTCALSDLEMALVRNDVTTCHFGQLRHRSGEVNGNDRLTAILYDLLRDHVPPSTLEQLVIDLGDHTSFQYTNGYLANYAADLASRISAAQVSLTTYQRLRHEAEDCGYVPTNADELLQQAAAEIDEYAAHHEGHTHETDEATTGDPAGSA